jgi:outer membrane protein OmpA-like peptidoglycan-associated protein
MTWGVKRFAALWLLVVSGAFTRADAQRPAPICTDPPSVGRSVATPTGTIQILDWKDTICLEHADRVRRLERLAEVLPPEERPVFRQYVLPRDQLPAGFDSGMPLLRIIFPERSFFDTASSRVRPEAQAALELIAVSLRNEVPDVAMFVAGHADDRGGEDYNYNLSVERADSVARRLVGLGVGGVALWRVGFGEAVPIESNHSEAGMAFNRRVEFVIGARTEPVASWLSQQTPRFCAGRASAVETCAKPLKRREFEAVALTERTGLVAPPPRSRKPVAAPIPRRKQLSVAGPAAVQTKVAIAQKARLIIPLSNQKRRIAAPLG